jgi:predicted nucleic acid-binding protein
MPVLRVVLDACILFDAALRDTLLRAAEAGLFEFRWSDAILDEVRLSLIRSGRTVAERAERLIAAIRAAFPEGRIDDFEPLIDRMPNHEDDRHVLAAAVVADARLIVTNNLRHYPAGVLRPLRVEAISPDVFLTALFDRWPETMTRIVARQAAVLRAPTLTSIKCWPASPREPRRSQRASVPRSRTSRRTRCGDGAT